MDFGLARTLEGDGMTQTGVMVGTMEYMSPEQAMGKDWMQRSDQFSAGLILSTKCSPADALSGRECAGQPDPQRPRSGPKPISEHDSTIPPSLSNIVSKCLERDPAARYQDAKALLGDLEAWQGKQAAGAIAFPSVGPWGQTIPWQWIGGIAAILVLAVAGFLFRDKLTARTGQKRRPPDLRSRWLSSLFATRRETQVWIGSARVSAEMLSTDVGQSAHLRSVSQDRCTRSSPTCELRRTPRLNRRQ